MDKKDYIFLKNESQKLKEDIMNEMKKKNKDDNKVRYLLTLLEQTVSNMEKIINSMY